MLSLHRSSHHPSTMMPWFAQPITEQHQKTTTTTTASPSPNFWLQVTAGSTTPLAASTTSSSSASSCTASTTVPPPLASSSSISSHSFYPSPNEVIKKQTRSTLRTVHSNGELNLPLGNLTFLYYLSSNKSDCAYTIVLKVSMTKT